ncbi:hypothetical protein PILCRDRAFT_185278 [Piloderma croceum F 1598]|uniref:Uncharacterized protein n=1 Tax=Piloderma croceum (strain F 1598) TaxID=765440 RepID=A0A0C3GFN7_PILCF|nr:hypothetical protein PILCRDRAFT_185278 [Piloderma croceum F 1598]
MGFLQRYFSIGTRRSKKQKGVDVYDVPPVPDLRRQHEQQEEAVNCLLRSSSARFAVMREVDYASLPPLRECNPMINDHLDLNYIITAHPIQHVLPISTASTSCLPSLSQRGTYTVKIHPRTVHSRTEFPNANPHESATPKRSQHDSPRRRSKSVPITPRDKSRLYGLRQDPSVISLLNLYDEHGCLNSKAFSNSPPSPYHEKHAQVRRGGSTLRQLLGDSSAPHAKNDGVLEGDISWAERHLCESADSSTSSLGVMTPSEAFFPDISSIEAHNDDKALLDSHDTQRNEFSYPVISSLEVELSMITENHPRPRNCKPKSPYEHDIPKTPQRASEVFAFLTTKKSQTRRHSQFDPEELRLPELSDPKQTPASRFSSYSSSAGSHESDIPPSNDTHTNYPNVELHELEPTPRPSYNQDSPSNWPQPPHSRMNNRRTSTAMSNNTLREDPSRQAALASGLEARRSHIPRSSRPLPQFPPKSVQATLSEQPQRNLNFSQQSRSVFEQTDPSNIATTKVSTISASNDVDVFTHMPSHLLHRHTPSCSSTVVSHASINHRKSAHDLTYVAATTTKPVPRELQARHIVHDKENDSEGTTLYNTSFVPRTPIRSRSIFRIPGDATPSPASSSDLSPVAQQLMADLRTQRMLAREREKKNGRWNSTTSKLKR